MNGDKIMRTIEHQWYRFLAEIMKKGEVHTKDNGDKIYEIMGNHALISNPCGFNNIITSDKFLDLMRTGAYDIDGYPMSADALYSYVSSLQFGSSDFVYSYPERLCLMKTVTREDEIVTCNQLKVMYERLKMNKGSNRSVATLYNCGLDYEEEDIPCLNWIQATIRHNKLMLHVMFRSNDCYGAFPANMLFITDIGLVLLEELKKDYPSLVFEGINYNSTSLHVYESDEPQVRKLLKNKGYL